MVSIKKNWFFPLGFILTFVLLINLFWVSQPTHIDNQALMIFEIHKCILDHQIPCRWVPDLAKSYGYPLFNYQPPLPYYFGQLFFLVTHSFNLSAKLMLSMPFLGAFYFMYLFALKNLGKRGQVIPIFYIILCFIYLTFLAKASVEQGWVLMFLPAILISVKMLSQKIRIQNILLCIISFAALVLSTTNPVLATGVIFTWIGYLYIQSKKTPFLLYSLGALFFSFLLSAFYLFPAIFERNLIHSWGGLLYLPKTTTEAPTRVTPRYEVLTGNSLIFNYEGGTNWLKFTADTKTHTIVRLSQFYFPQWKIFIDGKETQFEYKNNSLGLMTIILGEGKHEIYAKLFDTPIRTISNFISLVSFMLLNVLLIVQFKKIRSWLEYYRKRVN